jgi:NifU-like protein involved in Fe-S cluster formation
MSPEDRILDHYENPYHRHVPTKPYTENAIFVGTASNDCGDTIRVWGRYEIRHLRITGVWWEGTGCCFSQAAASMLAERCEAMRLHEVKAMSQDDMLSLFGLDVEQGRVECVMVAYRALMKALEMNDD